MGKIFEYKIRLTAQKDNDGDDTMSGSESDHIIREMCKWAEKEYFVKAIIMHHVRGWRRQELNKLNRKKHKKLIPKTCLWAQEDEDSDGYSTECGEMFQLNSGSPKKNGLKFCCFCGGKLKQAMYKK